MLCFCFDCGKLSRRVNLRATAKGTLAAHWQVRCFTSQMPQQMAQQMEHLASMTKLPVDQAKALHPAFYGNAEYSKLEREHIFAKNWFAAAHTAELSKVGDVKVVDVGSNSFILTRDKTGKLNAFHNSCRHRGARVCSSSQSGCKQLVCPYHWWAYRLDGTLKGTPPAATSKERKESLSLIRVPGVETFGGMIFLNNDPNPTPFADVLGDLPEKLKRYDLESMQLHGSQNYDIKGDWKLLAENFVDFYHVNAVHPELAKFSKVSDHQAYQGDGQYVGFVTAPLTNSGGAGDSHHFNSFPRLSNTEKNAALFFHIFPNVSVTLYPHSMYTLIMLPSETSGKTQEQLTMLMAPGAQKEQDDDETYKRKSQDLMDFVVKVNDEDVVAIENVQRGLASAQASNVQGEFLPMYDWSIHRFQNMVISGMQGELLDPCITPKLTSDFEKKLCAEVATETNLCAEAAEVATEVVTEVTEVANVAVAAATEVAQVAAEVIHFANQVAHVEVIRLRDFGQKIHAEVA